MDVVWWLLEDAARSLLVPPLLLALVVWLAYWDSLKGSWVQDDIDGTASQDGKWKHVTGGGISYVVANSGGTPPTVGTTGGSLWCDGLTYLRFHLGKSLNPKRGQWKDPKNPAAGKHPDFLPNARKHHRWSLTFGSAIAVLMYSALVCVVDPQIAFFTTLLFILHPVGVQCLGWISGIGYVLAAFFMLLALNWVLLVPIAWWSVALFLVFVFLAYRSQFTSLGLLFVLLSLHLWVWAAIMAGCFVVGGLLVLRDAAAVRKKTFTEQKMAASTYFHWKKVVVVGKTLYYYVKLVLFPKRLGLYHTFGYHYPLPDIEYEDKHFWAGVAIALGSGVALLMAPSPIPLGLAWFYGFAVFVLNWITVHQFVAERYMWLPSAGTCLIIASLAPPWLLWLLVGLALMRTWSHLPTYDNEIKYYQSNVWNFPTSEVAFGNLGVAYLRVGMVSSAIDMWTIGTQINPLYDVNFYNLYSAFKSAGQPRLALDHIKKALASPQCHFPEMWQKEHDQLDAEVQWNEASSKVPEPLRLTWQQQQLNALLADSACRFPDLWKAHLKHVNEELAKRQPTVVNATT